LLFRALFVWCAFVSGAVVLGADRWPQWRGPANDGISPETKVPSEWGEGKNEVWTLPMPGMAGSTPVVWGDRMFLTSADGDDIVLLCVSTGGKELWKHRLGLGKGKYFRDEGNDASASPCTDGSHVCAFTGAGDFVCVDFEGNEVWRFNAQERYGAFKILHGMHVTPVLHGDRLYLPLLHSGGWWVVALEKGTGKEVWKVERKTDGRFEGEHSYASPCLWSNGKDAYLVVHGCDYTTAHRLGDGGEIWRLGDLNPKDKYNATLRFVASPLATPELIIVPTAKNGPVVAVKHDASGAITAGSAAEQWRMPKGTPDVPSPLVHDGLLYLCRENGFLHCLDFKTGKEHYYQRLHGGRYRASPVYADGKLYLTCRDGTISVVKAGPKFELLAENKLPDTFTASPVIVGGHIYLRGFKTLYAIGSAK
jgi:outer membrane protein assembly factor BamB